jgi:DNA-binding protein
MREIHFFDLDNTLWKISNKIWIISKNNPSKPLLKISEKEFNLIKNGFYKKDNLKITYNDNEFFISKRMYEKIFINYRIHLNNLGISFFNLTNKNDIEKSKINFILDNIKHLSGKTNIDICILTGRNDREKHENVLNKLRLKLKDLGLEIFKIYMVGDKFEYNDNNNINIKKCNILLEHLTGLKIDKNKFVAYRQDMYNNVHFYDDDVKNINTAFDIQKMLNNYFKNTNTQLQNIILNNIKSNKPILNLHLVTTNQANRFRNTILQIKEPIKFSLNNENLKYLKNFNDFLS